MKDWRIQVVYKHGELREMSIQAQTGAAAIARVLNWKTFREDASEIVVVRVAEVQSDGTATFPDPWDWR